MTIRRFEDLDAWKEARKLVNLVFDATEQEPFRRATGLREQMQRAAVSVLSNVAEGFASGSNAEFVRFLRYARCSAAEVQCQAYVAVDRSFIDGATNQRLYDQAAKTSQIINGLKRHLAAAIQAKNRQAAEVTRKTNQRGNEPTR